jgi:predicted ester cyclase
MCLMIIYKLKYHFTMTRQEENKKIVSNFIMELAEKHNSNAWDMYCSEDFKHHFNIPDITPNREGVKKLSQLILMAFPDTSIAIDLLIAEGDFVVERSTVTATHSGYYNNIEPTGKAYQWQETHIFKLKNGKIIEHFPEVRLEKLLWQISGKGDGFIAPAKSPLSNFIAFMMSNVSKLYKNNQNTAMSIVENNKQIINRYVEEFKNQQRFSVFPKLFSSKFTHHFNFPNRANTMASFVSVGQTFLSAFPDVKVELVQILAENDIVVEQNKVTATHTGRFNGIKATHKKVFWTETHIYRLENGKIVENWPAVNFEKILMQIQ